MSTTSIRPLRWPDDRQALQELELSQTQTSSYQIRQSEQGFTRQLVSLPRPRTTRYPFDVNELPSCQHVLVAEVASEPIGLVAFEIAAWNRRAQIWHLYLDRALRGQGLGRELIAAVSAEARKRKARCLWLETQNTNPDAIAFYKHLGFRWCGLDTSLYDPETLAAEATSAQELSDRLEDIALFFMLPL